MKVTDYIKDIAEKEVADFEEETLQEQAKKHFEAHPVDKLIVDFMFDVAKHFALKKLSEMDEE